MPGGMIFETTAARMYDEFSCRVMCTKCGGDLWDVTIKSGESARIECSNPVCGSPLDAAAVDGDSGAGR